MNNVRDHIPLEQGLRPILYSSCRHPVVVRDHIPLEQGLRLLEVLLVQFPEQTVRDHIPLEQGLRQHRVRFV